MKNQFWKWMNTLIVWAFVLVCFIPSSSFSLYAQAKRGRNLQIGLILNLSPPAGEESQSVAPLRKSMLTLFGNSYGRRLVEVKPKRRSKASLDFLFYTGAMNQLDHLIEINGTASIRQTAKDKHKGKVSYQFSGTVRIIDVASLALVAQEEISFKGVGDLEDAPKSPTQKYDFITRRLIKEMLPFYNANLMKTMSEKKVADYFYGKKQCRRAYPIYKKLQNTSFSFEVGEELERRMKECGEQGAEEDFLKEAYRMNLKFSNLAKSYEKYFKEAFQQGKFKERFKKYSSKPVTLEVHYDKDKRTGAPGEFLLAMYFDAKKYNFPRKLPDGRIALNFSSLNGSIIYLLNFRTLSLRKMPEEQKKLFSRFSTRIKLFKANNDWVTFYVDIDKKKRVLAPMKMLIQTSGYESGEVKQADPAYANHNIFVLGNPIKPDGTETINIIAYKYFKIKT